MKENHLKKKKGKMKKNKVTKAENEKHTCSNVLHVTISTACIHNGQKFERGQKISSLSLLLCVSEREKF